MRGVVDAAVAVCGLRWENKTTFEPRPRRRGHQQAYTTSRAATDHHKPSHSTTAV